MYRLNLTMPEPARQRLQKLAAKKNCTVTEVLRRGVALYALYVAQEDAGGKFVLRDADGKCETLKLL